MIKLNDIPKKNCFNTPPDYFSDLEQELHQKIETQNNNPLKNKLYEFFKPYFYLAAGVVILVVLIRIGLEIGIGDYKQQKHKTEIVADESYLNDFFDIIIADENFIMTYILENDLDETHKEEIIDMDYLEDYLAQYIYELDLYNN